MKKGFNTRKLYYGFPIFIIGYQDEQNIYNITTCSSSYSLGRMLVVGISKYTNAAKQIYKYKRLSINILGEEHLDLIEYAGYFHVKSKLVDSSIPYDIYSEVPVLKDAQISLVANVEQVIEFDNFINFVCRIEERLFQDNMIQDEKIDYEQIKPVIYIGDDEKRVYKYLAEKTSDTGEALKQAKFKEL